MMKLCPCGADRDYLQCCGLYITGKQSAPTPEALMRSRYTAYSLANIHYIYQTMRGKPLLNDDVAQAQAWAKKVKWIDLKIIEAPKASAEIGYVEFIARFIEGAQLKAIQERSEFLCEDGRWFYIAQHAPTASLPVGNLKINRNSPCPCNSQKKFKNCCGR